MKTVREMFEKRATEDGDDSIQYTPKQCRVLRTAILHDDESPSKVTKIAECHQSYLQYVIDRIDSNKAIAPYDELLTFVEMKLEFTDDPILDDDPKPVDTDEPGHSKDDSLFDSFGVSTQTTANDHHDSNTVAIDIPKDASRIVLYRNTDR